MQRIRIFLASSSELLADREQFEILVARKAKLWADRGLLLQVELWEDALDALSPTRLQDEYNARIGSCDVFVLLFWSKVGRYTEEEFDTAVGRFQATRRPFIFTYFKDAPGAAPDPDGSGAASVAAFQQRLGALGHFYTVYRNVDALKLHFSQQLDKLDAAGFAELRPAQVAQGAEQVPGVQVHLSRFSVSAQGDGAFAVGGNVVGGNLTIHYGIEALPPTYRSRIKRFLQSYLGDEDHVVPFGGRAAELLLLDRWLADRKAPRNLLLTGPAASGKSALLVRWLQTLGDTGWKQDWKKVFVPISVRYETNRPDVFFGACACAVADVLGQRLQVPAGDAAQFYRDTLSELLDGWTDDDPACVLAIDGLDEALAWQLDTSVLPSRPHPRLRILVSAREMADCDAAGWERRVGWTVDRAPVQRLSIAGLDRAAVQQLVQATGLDDPPDLGMAIGDELFRLTAGDPLLLQLYLQEVQDTTAAADRPTGLAALRAAEPGFAAYFSAWMDQQRKLLEQRGSTLSDDVVKGCLALLACAAGPLRHADVEALLPRVLGAPCLVDGDTLQPIARFIVGDGTRQGYTYAHPKFGIFVREDHLRHGPWIARAEAAYLQWGAAVQGQLADGMLAPEATPPYLLQHLFLHLRAARAPLADWQGLTSDGWRRAWLAAEGGTNGLARDVVEVLRQAGRMAQVPGPDRVHAMALLARAALIHSSIRSRGGRIPGSLLAAGVRQGLLAPRTAIAIARARPDLVERVELLVHLLEVCPADDRDELAQEILAPVSVAEPWKLARIGAARACALQALGAGDDDPGVLAQWDQALGAMQELTPHSLQQVVAPFGHLLPPAHASRVLDLWLARLDTRLDGTLRWPLSVSLPGARLTELLIGTTRLGVMGPDPRHARAVASALPRLAPAQRLVVLKHWLAALTQFSAVAEPGGALPDDERALLQRLWQLSDGADLCSVRTLAMSLPLWPPAEATPVLDRLLACPPENRNWGDDEQQALRVALAHLVPPALTGRLLQALQAAGDGAALLALLPRLDHGEQARVLADSAYGHHLRVLASAALPSDAAHDALSRDAVRRLFDAHMDVHDECEQAIFESACLRLHPPCRDAHRDRTLAHLCTVVAGHDIYAPAEALRTVAPLLTAGDLLSLLQVATSSERLLLALADETPELALGPLLAALEPPPADVAAGERLGYEPPRALMVTVLRLVARGVRSPVVVGWLPRALATAGGEADAGLRERAWRSLSAVERADCRRRALTGEDQLLLLLAIGAAFDPDAEQAAADFDALFGPLANWLEGQGQPLQSYRSGRCFAALQLAAGHLDRLAPTRAAAVARALLVTLLSIKFKEVKDGVSLLLALALGTGTPEPQRQAALDAVLERLPRMPQRERIALTGRLRGSVPDAVFHSLCQQHADTIAATPLDDRQLGELLDLLSIAPATVRLPDWRSAMVVMLGQMVPELANEFEGELRQVIEMLTSLVRSHGANSLDMDRVDQGRRMLGHLGPEASFTLLAHGLTVASFAPRQAVLAVLTMAVPLLAATDGGRLLDAVLDSEREVTGWFP